MVKSTYKEIRNDVNADLMKCKEQPFNCSRILFSSQPESGCLKIYRVRSGNS